MTLLTNIKTLQNMEKAGLITLHPHTGVKLDWKGERRKAWYIEDAKNVQFKFWGKHYEVRFKEGCFYPFIYEM